MTEQVKWVGVWSPSRIGQPLQLYPTFVECIQYLLSLIPLAPVPGKVLRRSIERPHLVACVVCVRDNPELLAFRIKLIDHLSGDLDAASIEVEFPGGR